ncbi:hypothetical protein [Hyphococcus lacteus]|uniref:PRC-barrel domain-containing protein n=1 Tax=Hyphococcus lacteus TaxID=3143536 RepID=A0ABV3Z617_9PROT
MNKLLITAAASALLLPLSANAEQNKKTEMNAEAHAEMKQGDMKAGKANHDKTKKMSTKYEANGTVWMSPTSLSVKELLGEGIRGANGDRIARIDDLEIDAQGNASKAVFLSGGIFGLGGTRGALDYKQMDIAIDNDHEPIVSVSLSEEAVQSVAEYKTEKMNDYSLASEIIGAKVDLQTANENADDDAVINDLILSSDGRIEHVLVQKSAIGSIGMGERYAVAYSKLAVEQGDGGLVLDLSEAELTAAPRFSDSRNAMQNTWDKTRDGVKDAADNVGDAADDVIDQ